MFVHTRPLRNRSLPTRPRSHAPAWERTALHPVTLN